MNTVLTFLAYFYSRLLLLYPGEFRNEFGEEMLVVFNDSMDEAGKDGYLALALACLRELVNLPASLLRERLYEFQRKKLHMTTNENVDPRSTVIDQPNHRDAILGVLPFALYGVTSILAKIELPFHDDHLFRTFYFIMLIGLFWGLIKGVPRWTYIYLGWSLIHAWWLWWWTAGSTQELKILGFEINQLGWQGWIPLLATLVAAPIWRRSLRPFFQLIKRIWQDWTLLSVGIYTVVGWMMLLYDENHSPYLIVFMIASTLAISASVWFFMKSMKAGKRFIALLSGFVAGLLIDRICESTWDFAAYYGLPPGPSRPWYDSIFDVILITGFWALILFWPAIIGFVRYMRNNWQKPRMPA